MQEEDYEYYDEDSGGEGDKSTAANESYPQNQSVGSNYKGNAPTAGGAGGSKASSLADRFRKGATPTPIMS
jgi:hypothetical protein